ncbi:lantibiotic dehydratase [Streptomyces griseorubiginosus]|uniref:lantibiotic dehydratase n=1 Tax=Streptomyces griseorubiginosus TaxID=67304 RepID=UPI0033B27696
MSVDRAVSAPAPSQSPSPAVTAGGWKPVGVAILRMAGFPFGWLGELTDGTAVRNADQILALEDRLAEVWNWARRTRDVPPADRAVLRRLRGGRPPRPSDGPCEDPALRDKANIAADLHRQLAQAREEFGGTYQEDTTAGATATVRRFRGEPALRDALLVSSEQAAGRLTSWLDRHADDPGRWRSADRQALITLVRYLQRVCAKNETISHFGPFTVGAFSSDGEGVDWRPGTLTRTTLLSRWAAQAVAESLVPDRLRRPRRAPGAFLDGCELRVAAFRHTLSGDVRDACTVSPPVVLPVEEACLLAACDGSRTLTELAEHVRGAATDPDVDTVRGSLERLAALGAVSLGPQLPYGIGDSLTGVEDLATPARSGNPDEPAARIARLRALLNDLASAPYERRREQVDALKEAFKELTGRQSRRESDLRFYADHGLFTEDCTAPVTDVRFGRRIHDLVARELTPLHDLLLMPARLRHDGARRHVAAWYRSRFGDRSVSLDRYLAAFMADIDVHEDRLGDVDRRIRERQATVEADLLPSEEVGPDAPDYHCYRIPADAVLAATRSVPPLPAMCSPDAMIVARSREAVAHGDFQVVVGDAHATEDNLSHGMFSPHVSASQPQFAAELVEAYGGLVSPDETVVDVTQCHRNATFVRSDLPCPDLEAYDPAPRGRREVIALWELDVVPEAGALHLRHRRSGHRIRPMAAPLAWCGLSVNPMEVFAFPSRVTALAAAPERRHVPRLMSGRVVLQRERWRIPVADVLTPTPETAFLATQRLRRRLRLPRHVFAKVKSQPKPVYCDLDSPLLVRSLLGLLSRDHEDVEISEMLPGPENLWWEIDGDRRTSELRYTVFATGTAPRPLP